MTVFAIVLTFLGGFAACAIFHVLAMANVRKALRRDDAMECPLCGYSRPTVGQSALIQAMIGKSRAAPLYAVGTAVRATPGKLCPICDHAWHDCEPSCSCGVDGCACHFPRPE